MVSGQLVGRWLVRAGNSRLVVRLRPVSRLPRVSAQWVGRLLMLVGRSGPNDLSVSTNN